MVRDCNDFSGYNDIIAPLNKLIMSFIIITLSSGVQLCYILNRKNLNTPKLEGTFVLFFPLLDLQRIELQT